MSIKLGSLLIQEHKCQTNPNNLLSNTTEMKYERQRNLNETGVINDPLGQPTVLAGSDFRLILKFWDGRTDRRTNGRTDRQPM